MRSLAKPRKITIRGSNGQIYMFLGKPKDDLRKDARLMDFNTIINKLLKANSDSRRRQLRMFTLTSTNFFTYPEQISGLTASLLSMKSVVLFSGCQIQSRSEAFWRIFMKEGTF